MFGGTHIKLQWYNIYPSLFLLLQRNFFPLRLCHQTSATKLRYLRSSVFYRQPLKYCGGFMYMLLQHWHGSLSKKCKKDKISIENFIVVWKTKKLPKNGQISWNGQVCFFMANAFQKWPQNGQSGNPVVTILDSWQAHARYFFWTFIFTREKLNQFNIAFQQIPTLSIYLLGKQYFWMNVFQYALRLYIISFNSYSK